jgi:hypothetical protein
MTTGSDSSHELFPVPDATRFDGVLLTAGSDTCEDAVTLPSYSSGVLTVCTALAVLGLAHIVLPQWAKAVWDFVYSREYARWEEGDLRGYDPLEPRHRFDASLLSYRLTGVGLIAIAGLILYYAR